MGFEDREESESPRCEDRMWKVLAHLRNSPGMDVSSTREGFPCIHQVMARKPDLDLAASCQGLGWGSRQNRHSHLLV